MELFQAYGFKKVSINDIAQKAGVSQVTIYNHFGSKDELVRDVIKSLLRRMLARYRDLIREEGPFLEKLKAIVFDKSEVVGQFQGELTRTALSQDLGIRQFVESIWQGEVNQLLIELFEDGRRQGYINPDLSQEAILAYYEIFLQGIYNSPKIQARMAQSPKLVRELISTFTYGLNGGNRKGFDHD
ncbi:MAG: TetR/AcrR family transcriptional regulator [Chloroflexi bacterium]|nr:TetR/AcrR family transcriptional regulator [Chloroflexota bacterium]